MLLCRFADILGLDLSEVKTFIDEIPKVPKAAFADLDVSLSDIEVGSPVITKALFPQMPAFHVPSSRPTTTTTQSTSLVPMFNQPGGSSNFLDTVKRQKICLENAFMQGPSTVFGIVRVQNISFHKSVVVRWTEDDWRTVRETEAEWTSSHRETDKFSFKLVMMCEGDQVLGHKLQFCLRYECSGEHWDSNNGTNYVFQVMNLIKYSVSQKNDSCWF